MIFIFPRRNGFVILASIYSLQPYRQELIKMIKFGA
jgi:hypothetical protein